jgi:hypothetical protein
MSLVHTSSQVTTIPELDLFDTPLTQTAVENEYCLDVRPISTISANSVIEFVFGGESRDYINLAKSRLYAKVKIVHQDGTVLTKKKLKTDGTADPAGPAKDEEATSVNLAMHAMFNQIDVYINGVRMSQASGMYPYKAIVQTVLDYAADTKETQLKAVGYKQETGKDLDTYSITDPSIYWRHKLFRGSQSVEFEGPLLEDVLQLKRYLLNNMKVQIKLYPSQKQFYIAATDETKDYKIVLEDIVFKACMVKVNPGVILGHAKAMESRNALYNYTRCETKSYSIPANQRTVYLDNLFQGIRPSKLIVGMVSSEGFNGAYKRNPFKFHHYDLTNIALIVDGDTVPGRPMKLDFSDGVGGQNFIEAYVNMYQALGLSGTDFGGGLTPEIFAQGHTLFVYTLDPVIASGRYMNLTRHSNVRLELNFAKPLPETVTMLLVTKTPAVFEVDAARNVILPNQ